MSLCQKVLDCFIMTAFMTDAGLHNRTLYQSDLQNAWKVLELKSSRQNELPIVRLALSSDFIGAEKSRC